MTSAFQTAVSAGLDALRIVAGETVTYSRGASEVTGGLTAVPGRTNTQRPATDQSGVILELKVQDWLIEAAELVIDGLRAEPQRFDKITRTLPDGTVETYEVQTLGGVKCWEASDTGGNTIRVHTKLIKSERG